MKQKKEKSYISIFFTALLVYGINCIVFQPPLKPDRYSYPRKACFSNIRRLSGAVETYNMNNTPMMTELDLKRLIDSHYLKEEVKGSEPECRYYSQGDLTNDGVICCELHGCLTASATSKIAKEREKKLAEEKYKDELFISCARALAPVLYLMFALMQ